MSALLTYAHNEAKRLVHIDSVENGEACHCTCPNCGNPLIAKNGGSIRDHHFAHFHDAECENAYETTLHLLAKKVIREAKAIMLPRSESETFPHGLVQLHSIKEEEWDSEYGFKPDLEAFLDNGERLLIEIYVTNEVSKSKREKIVEHNLKCVEIDMNWVEMDEEKIRKFLLDSTKHRQWVQKQPAVARGDGMSSSYGRNPLHQNVIEALQQSFDRGELTIYYLEYPFNLKELGYDVCERRAQSFRGLRSDLLLYRSNYENKGYLSINVRGRKRNEKQPLPEGVRILDILIRDSFDYDLFMNSENNERQLTYLGCWGDDNIFRGPNYY